jgi:hypothetical protein
MKVTLLRGCVLAFAATLAGCATSGGQSGTDVTRFHLNQPVARSTISVDPVGAADRNNLEFNYYRAAVARQLERLGWTVVPSPMASEQVALIDVRQGSREAFAERSPVSIGIGGGTGGWNSGVGGGISFGLGGGGSREVVATLLQVSIRRRSDGSVFWEGRAETENRVGKGEAERTMVVEKLAEALFRDFPGESGRTIRVR